MAADKRGDGNKNFKKQERDSSDLLLPISRVKTIMKSSPDVESIAQDALYAVTAATELFIKELVHEVYDFKSDDDDAEVSYDDLANFVNENGIYAFLEEIIPQKVTGREILASRNKSPAADDSS